MTTTGTYEHILETMHDGVLALSDTGTVILYNKAAAGILGIAPDQVMGKLLMEIPFAEDSRNDEFTQVVLSAVYNKGENLRTGTPYVRPDGTELYLDVASAYRAPDESCDFCGVILVFTDITELRAQYDKERDLTARLTEAYRDLEGEAATIRVKMGRSRLVRRLGLAVVALMLLAGGYYFYAQHFAGGGVSDMGDVGGMSFAEEVRVRPVTLKVSLTGSFEPLDIVNVVSPFNGRVTHKDFAFGQQVAKGDFLLQLDTAELEVKLREAESAYIKAKQEYDTVKDWERSMEVSNAKRAFVKAKKSLDDSREKLQVSQDLLDRGIIPEEEHQSQKTSFENLEMDYTSSQEQLQSVLDKGSPDNVLIAEMAMKNALYNFDSIKDKLAGARILAPVDGLVIHPKGEGKSQAKAVEVGTGFQEGDILLAVANTEGLTVSTKADEVDMVKLRIGQSVSITGDAFPDMVLSGTVASISSQATSEGGLSRGATFEVKIRVDGLTPGQRERIKLGMQATMEVAVYENPSAIVVPLDAVSSQGGKHFVTLETPEGPQPREVEVGMTTLSAVEIKQGLSEGDRIIVDAFGAPVGGFDQDPGGGLGPIGGF